MPGRQSTGPAAQKKAKPKNQTKKRSLNALAIAEQQDPTKVKIRRNRLGESEPDDTKRKRNTSDGDGDGEEDEDIVPGHKRPRFGAKDRFGNEIEGGSDSEGNAWVTGQVDSEDDSDLDSDDAMGESDEERFEGFVFQGSSSMKKKKKARSSTSGHANNEDVIQDIDLHEGDQEDERLDEESDDFAEEAVDLTTILDASDDDKIGVQARANEQDESIEDDGSGGDDHDSSEDKESILSISDVEDETNDTTKLSALQNLVSSLGNGDPTEKKVQHRSKDAQEAAIPSEYGINPTQKLSIADILPTVTDPKLRKSLKLLDNDNKKASRKLDGIPQKLDVPLAKRQQDRLDRAAAYEKSKQTLSRWIDTVKHNRRAEHLSFPLTNPDSLAAKDTKRLLLNSESKPMTSLEATIQNILVDSGLAPEDGKSQEDQLQDFEELALNKVPIEEVQARRAELRRARELLFREEIRAKRIKKIKSKSYRRVHRKERERHALRNSEALAEAGVAPSEDEQERDDRRRAEERMGARHRESKWAKGVKESGRAAWDEDARSGVTEMARREEELRRRILGKDIHREDASLGSSSESSDEDLSEGDDHERETRRLKDKLNRLSGNGHTELAGPGSRLSSMKFMQKAEAARQEQNDADVERLRRELAGEDSPEETEAIEPSGRRSYGPNMNQTKSSSELTAKRNELEEGVASDEEDANLQANDADQEVDIVVNRTPYHAENPFAKHTRTAGALPSRKHTAAKNPIDAEPGVADEDNPWLNIRPKKANNRDRRTQHDDEILITANPDTTPLLPRGLSRTPRPTLTANAPKATEALKSHAPKPPSQDPQILPSLSDDSDSFTGFSLTPSTPPSPILTNQDLINHAFAGDDVLASFAAEKAAAALADAPQTLSTALPGWGAWAGEGISKRERKHQAQQARHPRNVTTTPGIEPAKRKDARMERVLVNEKRVKKNAKYLASELPFPFESRAQYERSLRLPVGPEWTTKEVFQRATMPRVVVRQGVIGAMERPVV
ncbi:hypothetical protein MMC13_000810 [Lambiella insularis]|nr:hypothetical protein [Lambiella insularis]